jgi:hypothetical protein
MLLGAVVLHVVANFAGFRQHLSTRRGQLLVGAFALVLLLSFVSSGEPDEPPFVLPIRALSQTPLTTLCQVARITPEQLHERLAQAGVQSHSDQQSLSDLVGSDVREQMRILGLLLAETK